MRVCKDDQARVRSIAAQDLRRDRAISDLVPAEHSHLQRVFKVTRAELLLEPESSEVLARSGRV